MPEQLLKLPEKPGTVIAIGDWWLVRLRPYQGAPSAWELLPMPDAETSVRAKSLGVREQCVYGDEWVLAEVEQEGGYVVISDPRDVPSGVQYFRQELAQSAEPERVNWTPTWSPGDRVRLVVSDGEDIWHGYVVDHVDEDTTLVRWDHDPMVVDRAFSGALEPEPRPIWDGLTYPLPIGARVRHTNVGLRHLRGEIVAHEVLNSDEPEKYTAVAWDGHDTMVATVQVHNLEPEGDQ